MSSQKLILLTNSKNTTPASYDDPALFTANLPTTIMLPANCEVCLGAYSVDEAVPANLGRLLYVNLNNLPFGNVVANTREGLIQRLVGCIQSNVSTTAPQRWTSLNNQYEIPLTSIDVLISNQDGEKVVNLQGLTEIVLYYRKEAYKL